MKVLVTGGTGYIGSSVVPLLKKCGYEPILFSRRLGGDITNLNSVKRAMHGCRAVIHLAASKDHTGAYKTIRKVNVKGTENVLKAALHEHVKRVVIVSSVAATERIKLPYSVSKHYTEDVAHRYQSRMIVPIIRLAPVYDYERLSLLRKWKIFPLFDMQLHLVWKESAARALVAALERGKSKTYTIADKAPIRTSELYKAVKKYCYGINVPRWSVIVGEYFAEIVAFIFKALNKRPPITAALIRAYTQNRSYDISEAVKDLKYHPVDTKKKWRELLRKRVNHKF